MTMKLFFISDKYLGDSVTLKPKIPETALDDEEKVTPRICVSPSMAGCIMSTCVYLHADKLYVYYTDMDQNKAMIPNANQVPDVDVFAEMWITKNEHFILYDVMEVEEIKLTDGWSLYSVRHINNAANGIKNLHLEFVDLPRDLVEG